MEKFFVKEIRKMQGSLIAFGLTNDILKQEIEKNNNINTCYLLDSTSNFNKKKLTIFNRGKTVNIKKIKRVFKKKRIDNVIANYQTIKPFLKTFIRDSVYINKNKLYIYGAEEDYEDLIQRYKRYTSEIEVKKEKDYFIIIIDNNNTTNNKIKDIIYWWKDTFTSIADFLTVILVN